MPFKRPEYLVETSWLADHLEDPAVRVLECTVFLYPKPTAGVRAESGRAAWAQGHIPGSGFADLTTDLCDQSARLLYMMPPVAAFAEAMSRLGVGNGVQAVLYDRDHNMWAARVWWMLRAAGFDDAAVLNGGWKKWMAEGRPISTDLGDRPPCRLVPHPRPGLFVGKEDVRAAIGDGRICLLNALTDEQYRGTGGVQYGRPGRIPSSMNLPARAIVDSSTHAYLPPDTLRARFAAVGATDAGRVITYCGGGIAASSDAFALTLLGHDNVAVYDASLAEWAQDPTLPMETG
ncbi:MAG: sulfurtransferase [Candidatus Rokuibacteriota bacterium]